MDYRSNVEDSDHIQLRHRLQGGGQVSRSRIHAQAKASGSQPQGLKRRSIGRSPRLLVPRRFCINCGSQQRPHAKFCSECGSRDFDERSDGLY